MHSKTQGWQDISSDLGAFGLFLSSSNGWSRKPPVVGSQAMMSSCTSLSILCPLEVWVSMTVTVASLLLWPLQSGWVPCSPEVGPKAFCSWGSIVDTICPFLLGPSYHGCGCSWPSSLLPHHPGIFSLTSLSSQWIILAFWNDPFHQNS